MANRLFFYRVLNVSVRLVATAEEVAAGVCAMRVRAITLLVVAALSAAMFVAVRSANRADAANGNCYSDASGPTSPTICD
jgi:hypothetical protein